LELESVLSPRPHKVPFGAQRDRKFCFHFFFFDCRFSFSFLHDKGRGDSLYSKRTSFSSPFQSTRRHEASLPNRGFFRRGKSLLFYATPPVCPSLPHLPSYNSIPPPKTSKGPPLFFPSSGIQAKFSLGERYEACSLLPGKRHQGPEGMDFPEAWVRVFFLC